MGRDSGALVRDGRAQLGGVGWPPERAAEVIGCSVDHVRALCRIGHLVAVRERRRWFIDPGSARSYLVRRQRERGGA